MRTSLNTIIGIPVEGWVVIAGTVATWRLLLLVHEAAWGLLALVPLQMLFFADRNRAVPSKPRGVLSPVDGRIVHRRECHDPMLDREAIRVSIRVSLWGAYSLRSPIEGEHVRFSGVGDRSSVVRTDEGDEIVIRMRSGSLLGALPIWTPVGDRIGQGRRCGLRRLVRELDLYLPANARVEVAADARVRSGQTVIATLLRKNPA